MMFQDDMNGSMGTMDGGAADDSSTMPAGDDSASTGGEESTDHGADHMGM